MKAKKENKSIGFDFAFHEDRLKWIEDPNSKGVSAQVIDIHLGMINDFIKTVAILVFDLQRRFEEIKRQKMLEEKYPPIQKSCPAPEPVLKVIPGGMVNTRPARKEKRRGGINVTV